MMFAQFMMEEKQLKAVSASDTWLCPFNEKGGFDIFYAHQGNTCKIPDRTSPFLFV
jgi:hypothetical protein